MNISVNWVGEYKKKTRTFKYKSQNGPQIYQQLKWCLRNRVIVISSNTLIHIQRGDCDITKANTPQQLRIFNVLSYCSYHKWALITSISFVNTPDFRLLKGCLQTRGVFWWWRLHASEYSNILHIMALHVCACAHPPHARGCFPCLPLVGFPLSAFIWIKIRLRPDILLIWVVSSWRISDLDEMSHSVKSDSQAAR